MAQGPRLRGTDREQSFLRPVFVDKLIPEDHPARAIWELVGQLDLRPYYKGIKAVEGVAGRPTFDPRELISLWVLAYSEGVGSAREVSRLCDQHPAYQWLTGMQPVNYHSMADFRVEYKEPLDDLFVQILGVMSAERLVTLERVTQDGTKIKASAGGKSFRRESRLKKCLEEARQQVEAMGDPESEKVTRRRQKARARARLESAVREIENIQSEKGEEARVSRTDPDARVMKQSDGGFAPSFNTQICTDAEAGVVVGVYVTQAGNDIDQLVPGMDKVKETMGQEPQQVLVDGGYSSRDNIGAMADRHIDLVAPTGKIGGTSLSRLKTLGIDPEFYPEHFVYDQAADQYQCPAGKALRLQTKEEMVGCTNFRYQARVTDCSACPFKTQCCPKTKKGRVILRRVESPEVTSFLDRMASEEAKTIYRQRSRVAEFVNAWIK